MRILLAIDDSACAVAAANTLVKQFTPSTTHIDVLHVDEWPRGMPASMAFAEGKTAAQSVLSPHQAHRDRAADLVASTAEQLRRAGFSTSASLREGDARHTIVECAKECHADLIVLGSHLKRGLERMIGSVSDSVARRAPCSVQMVRAVPAGPSLASGSRTPSRRSPRRPPVAPRSVRARIATRGRP